MTNMRKISTGIQRKQFFPLHYHHWLANFTNLFLQELSSNKKDEAVQQIEEMKMKLAYPEGNTYVQSLLEMRTGTICQHWVLKQQSNRRYDELINSHE